MLNFDGIMKDALEVGLLTTNELDRLTDEVASGAKTEAALAEEWGEDALRGAEDRAQEVRRRADLGAAHPAVQWDEPRLRRDQPAGAGARPE